MITFDIETIPTDDPTIIAEIAATITHPKTMSKAETIAKWVEEEKPKAVEETVSKTSFDGTYGRICCIGWAVDHDEPMAICSANEREVIETFLAAVHSAADIAGHTFVGHNITSFDLRFLWQRCIINRIKPSSSIPFSAKPWDRAIGDTMTMWNPERERRISLDRLCKALGVTSSKDDMDGSKVWDTYQAGEYDKIAAYCKDDVSATRECYLRMIGS